MAPLLKMEYASALPSPDAHKASGVFFCRIAFSFSSLPHIGQVVIAVQF